MATKVRRKRMVLWIVGIVVLLGATAVATLFWQGNRVQQAMTDFIIAHPAETAVVTYTFDKNGNLVDDDSALFYNADTPLVVASVMKTAVLAAYAVPKRSALRGKNRVVVLLTNGLSPDLFTQQVQFQGHYLLPIDLAQACTHFARLRH